MKRYPFLICELDVYRNIQNKFVFTNAVCVQYLTMWKGTACYIQYLELFPVVQLVVASYL